MKNAPLTILGLPVRSVDLDLLDGPPVFGPLSGLVTYGASFSEMLAIVDPVEVRCQRETLKMAALVKMPRGRDAQPGDDPYAFKLSVEVGKPDTFLGIPIVEDDGISAGTLEFRGEDEAVRGRATIRLADNRKP